MILKWLRYPATLPLFTSAIVFVYGDIVFLSQPSDELFLLILTVSLGVVAIIVGGLALLMGKTDSRVQEDSRFDELKEKKDAITQVGFQYRMFSILLQYMAGAVVFSSYLYWQQYLGCKACAAIFITLWLLAIFALKPASQNWSIIPAWIVLMGASFWATPEALVDTKWDMYAITSVLCGAVMVWADRKFRKPLSHQ